MLFLTAAAMSYKEKKMVALITQAVGSFIKLYLLMLFVRVLLTWWGRAGGSVCVWGGVSGVAGRSILPDTSVRYLSDTSVQHCLTHLISLTTRATPLSRIMVVQAHSYYMGDDDDDDDDDALFSCFFEICLFLFSDERERTTQVQHNITS